MTLDRNLLSEGVIAGGLCAALAFGMLAPADGRLARARAAQAEARVEARETEALLAALPANTQRLEALEARREALQADSLHATDAAALHAWIETLAREHGVRLEQVNPERLGTRAGRRVADDPRVRREGDAGVGLSLVVHGEFGAITAFVDAIERGSTLARVGQLEIMPSPQAGVLMAVVTTRHAAPDLSPLSERERAVLEGGSR